MLGALYRYLREATPSEFQPMNSNFGLLDPLADHVRDKGERKRKLIERARNDFTDWLQAEALAWRQPAMSAERPLSAGAPA
jgi:methylenetetrahydrofolate--tRNA-(uracil-5-)-methyltransferase